jgi:predicted transglutaminase-like cysteine proteinase
MSDVLLPTAWTAFENGPAPTRRYVLDFVNRAVNNAIDPRTGEMPDVMEAWQIGPRVGWCHDYAVTKRWLLLALGFKASELLLCECISPDGEHHMILLVNGLALDNLRHDLRPMAYPVVRCQSATSQDFWETAT